MHACWCSDVIEDAGNQLIEHLGFWEVVVSEMMCIGTNRRSTAIAVIDCKHSFWKNKKEAKTQSEVRTKWCMAVLEDLFGAVG